MPGSKLCGILIFVGEANKITECGSAGIGRQARLRILWVYARVGSSPISRMMQKWRNWQTRTVQVRVVAIPWGFKSLLLHDNRRQLFDKKGCLFFCLNKNNPFNPLYEAEKQKIFQVSKSKSSGKTRSQDGTGGWEDEPESFLTVQQRLFSRQNSQSKGRGDTKGAFTGIRLAPGRSFQTVV